MNQEPKLYIKSPSYFLDVSLSPQYQDMEESTSVFDKNILEKEQEIEQKEQLINEYVLKQFKFLEKPFRQKVYRPLLITLKDGRKLSGNASNVQEDSLMLTSEELQTQEIIHIEDVQQILWRGNLLPTL